LQSAVSTRKGPVATDPPERRAFSCLHALTSVWRAGPLPSGESRARLQPGSGAQILPVATDPPERRAFSCLHA